MKKVISIVAALFLLSGLTAMADGFRHPAQEIEALTMASPLPATYFSSDYAKAVADPPTYRAMGELLLDALKTRVGYALEDKYGLVTLSDKFVGNNWAQMTCFLVELGFMSTPREDYLLSHPVYQQWLAEGLTQGVYEIALYRGWITE